MQAMLDAVIDFLPSPVDIPPVQGTAENDEPLERHANDNEPFSALAFKIMTDPFVGQLIFFRVYSGVNGATNTTRSRTRRNAWAVSCRCTPTSAKRSRKCWPATSPQPWA
nr:hypothetical protein [Ralstonia solanacearum]